jgi:hypothetical protein
LKGGDAIQKGSPTAQAYKGAMDGGITAETGAAFYAKGQGSGQIWGFADADAKVLAEQAIEVSVAAAQDLINNPGDVDLAPKSFGKGGKVYVKVSAWGEAGAAAEALANAAAGAGAIGAGVIKSEMSDTPETPVAK